MPLRRKPATIHKLGKALTLRASLPAHLKRDPYTDYLPVATIGSASVCEHRGYLTRQLVMIQEVKSVALSDFSVLAQIAHENIARPLAFYSSEDRSCIVYEYVDMDLLKILPLQHEEIAAAMAQVFYVNAPEDLV
ncbi:hypothetical protein Purlil1_13215 [Purpureocillium lilacinum]|uniref:Protein kinase domain-containing protein n=1 Tax=Purpureocillium lilacinum TaxID=33203 RepID=A0ABR0BES6_PURLI|nr:hypothetical protein Purlil1_13215 [Purpureocillium lilacinum]